MTGHEPTFRDIGSAGPEGDVYLHTWNCTCGARGTWTRSREAAVFQYAEHAPGVRASLLRPAPEPPAVEDFDFCLGCGAEDHEPCTCGPVAA
jgi:hypothetical protein